MLRRPPIITTSEPLRLLCRGAAPAIWANATSPEIRVWTALLPPSTKTICASKPCLRKRPDLTRHPQRGMAGRDTAVDDRDLFQGLSYRPVGCLRSNRKKCHQPPQKNGYPKPCVRLHKSPLIGPHDIAAFKSRICSRDPDQFSDLIP